MRQRHNYEGNRLVVPDANKQSQRAALAVGCCLLISRSNNRPPGNHNPVAPAHGG